MSYCRESLILGLSWLNLDKPEKWVGGLYLSQDLIKMMPNRMKWVVKFAFYKETDVWLYEPYFSNPENPLCDIHVNIKVLKK